MGGLHECNPCTKEDSIATDRISTGFILFIVNDQQGLSAVIYMHLKSIPYAFHAPPSSSALV
jgi:hypothetical protein